MDRRKPITKKGQPNKGYKWSEQTSGRIPDPQVTPTRKPAPVKAKPMRSIKSGSTGSGSARTTVTRRTRSK